MSGCGLAVSGCGLAVSVCGLAVSGCGLTRHYVRRKLWSERVWPGVNGVWPNQ